MFAANRGRFLIDITADKEDAYDHLKKEFNSDPKSPTDNGSQEIKIKEIASPKSKNAFDGFSYI